MSKPTLADLPARYQDQIARQLYGLPHPRTVAIEAVEPPKRTKPRHKKADPLRFAPFLRALERAGLPAPIVELKFHSSRRWRFDFAWYAQVVAVEVEGGVWTGGRHTRGKGYLNDCEKYNAATELGWRVLRYTPQQLTKAETIAQIKRVYEGTT
jgi:hypothetical protein